MGHWYSISRRGHCHSVDGDLHLAQADSLLESPTAGGEMARHLLPGGCIEPGQGRREAVRWRSARCFEAVDQEAHPPVIDVMHFRWRQSAEQFAQMMVKPQPILHWCRSVFDHQRQGTSGRQWVELQPPCLQLRCAPVLIIFRIIEHDDIAPIERVREFGPDSEIPGQQNAWRRRHRTSRERAELLPTGKVRWIKTPVSQTISQLRAAGGAQEDQGAKQAQTGK
ncbi:MAG: hypothetical protein ABIW30_04680, partial [Arenimonas sp.]